jgi:UDP-glucose 4-epimerase
MPKRPGEPDCTWADITKIQRDLGWKQQVPFEKGIEAMLANIEYWREAPIWDVTSIEKATKNWFNFMEAKK